MKIKRFNENIKTKPEDVVVKASFSGEVIIPLNNIKKTEYMHNYYRDISDQENYESAIYYGVENYLHEQGSCNFTISYETTSGETIENLEEYEKLLKNTEKYNL